MNAHYKFTPHWIGEIIQYESFCQSVSKVWEEVYPDKLSDIYNYIDSIFLPLDKAWQNNCERWDFDATQTVDFITTRIKGSLAGNIEWFNSHLPHAQNSAIADPTIKAADTYRVYDLQGLFIREASTMDEALSNLQKGIYIVNGQKICVTLQ